MLNSYSVLRFISSPLIFSFPINRKIEQKNCSSTAAPKLCVPRVQVYDVFIFLIRAVISPATRNIGSKLTQVVSQSYVRDPQRECAAERPRLVNTAVGQDRGV